MKELLWVDVETTGLDPNKDLLLEVAVVLTDEQLRIKAEFVIPIGHDKKAIELALAGNNYVRNMHTENGLLATISNCGKAIEDAEYQLIKGLLASKEAWRAPIMAGSCPSFDRRFLEAHMPTLARLFSHQHFDMTTFRAMWPDLGKPSKLTAHRAYEDIMDDIDQARRIYSRIGDLMWDQDRLAEALEKAATNDNVDAFSFQLGWRACSEQ